MVWVKHASPEVNAQSQYPTIITICVVLTSLSVLVVSSRLWIRHKARGLVSDDFMAILSEIFVILYAGLCIGQTKYGLGLPLLERPKANLSEYLKLNFAGRPIYQIGISFFKVALLLSYLRLLEGTAHRTYRMVVWGILALVLLGHFACALCLIFACSPVEASWKPVANKTCLPTGPSFTGYAAVTIISDVAVAIVPIPILARINIDLKKKLGLCAVFALGLFTTVCSVLRYLQINRIQYGDGNSTMLILWGVIEFNVGNIVSSLPFLAPVFVRKARQYRTKGYSGGSGTGSKRASKGWGRNFGDRYKLSSVGKDKSTVGSDTFPRSDSEEIILHDKAIIKSITYSIKVEDGTLEGPSNRQKM